MKVHYFSLRTNSWSCTKGTIPYDDRLKYRQGLLLNGALHWLVKTYDNVSAIIALDVMERRLSKVSLLHNLAIRLESEIYRLMVREGCLCLYSLGWKSEMPMPKIWTMKEYKMQPSWTKSFVLSTNYYHLFSTFFPLCFFKNGEILALNDRKTLVRLNDKGELLDCTRRLDMDRYYSAIHCAMYRESLLSLPREIEEATKEDEQKQQ
ncbi:F-box protein CPR30 [Spatholobus suberectus]|nr:F-box protein CPR30 [Spatholobus suberectus]